MEEIKPKNIIKKLYLIEQLCNVVNIMEYTKEEGFICFLALMAAADLDLIDAAVSIDAADLIDVVGLTDAAEDFGSNIKN